MFMYYISQCRCGALLGYSRLSVRLSDENDLDHLVMK